MKQKTARSRKLNELKQQWDALEIDRAALSAKLGWDIKNSRLFLQALTHKSYFDGQDNGYERLEFMGDRVLGLCASEMLFERFPEEPEGALARRFNALVCQESLADIATRMELGPLLVMSESEDDTGGRENPAILADVVESLIACLYMDGGLEVARTFVTNELSPLMDQDREPPKDPKSGLQEWAQGNGLPLPHYKEISRTGPDHAPVFEIEVSVSGVGSVRATGASKRIAERQAASGLLEKITLS